MSKQWMAWVIVVLLGSVIGNLKVPMPVKLLLLGAAVVLGAAYARSQGLLEG